MIKKSIVKCVCVCVCVCVRVWKREREVGGGLDVCERDIALH
jgi:hypothetical protein